MAKIVLFALPYAGGSAQLIFTPWRQALGREIELVMLEYPGHGRRMIEPFASSIAVLAQDLLRDIARVARLRPYALYAHSMGCLVLTELLRQIVLAGLPEPEAVFLSGRNPPHLPYPRTLHLLSDAEFLAEIHSLGGTAAEFFRQPELQKMFLPILRSDYQLCELWPVQPASCLTYADLTFIFSDADPMVSLPAVQQWQHYSRGQFRLVQLRGPHFFIHQQYAVICQYIRRQFGWSELPAGSELAQ